MMVQSPVTVPGTAAELEENLDNPALFLLPITGLVPVPDSLRSITLPTGSAVTPVRTLPRTNEALPALRASQFVITSLPYQANDSRTLAVYTADYQYQTRSGNRRGLWPGPKVAASLRLDAAGQPTVGLFSLPLVDDTGAPVSSTSGSENRPTVGCPAASRRRLAATLGPGQRPRRLPERVWYW